ncbi:hypothetical protein [Paraliobacillus zengyii]|uniref:hypothetical protein n=1 Tax=Paraliobacillus zengyii TaxID=2213194 RepID=UPI000DD35DB4|nr:hypothetical protein [Paraliobacillus zengyii]
MKKIYGFFTIVFSVFIIAACNSEEETDTTIDNEETIEQENEDMSESDSTNETEEQASEGNDTTEESVNEENESDTASEEESTSNEETVDGVTEGEAEEIVRNEAEGIEDLIVAVDHLNEEGNYVVHVYEIVENDGSSHTATYGWYIVNAIDGTVENMME